MKRRIIAATQKINLGGLNIEEVFGEFEAKAANAGYTFNIDSNLNITMEAEDKLDYMPSIEVTTEIEGNSARFYPRMSFPELDTTKVQGDVPWYLNKWSKVAKFVRDLHLFIFTPEEWEGYETEEI